MGKIVRNFAFGIFVVGVLSAAVAMFAEPFFSKLYRRLGIDTSKLVDPMLSFFSSEYSHLAFAAMIGFGLGVFIHYKAIKIDKKKGKSIATLETPAVSNATNQEIKELKEKVERLSQWPIALQKKKIITKFLNNLEDHCKSHDQAKARLYSIVRDGDFNPDHMSDSWRSFQREVQNLREVWRAINQEYNDLFGEYIDFEETPKLKDNPFAYTPNHLDNLHSDAQKYDYRRAHEQIQRFDKLIWKIKQKANADIAAQEGII